MHSAYTALHNIQGPKKTLAVAFWMRSMWSSSSVEMNDAITNDSCLQNIRSAQTSSIKGSDTLKV